MAVGTRTATSPDSDGNQHYFRQVSNRLTENLQSFLIKNKKKGVQGSRVLVTTVNCVFVNFL